MKTYEVKVTFVSNLNIESYDKSLQGWFDYHFIDDEHEELVNVEIKEKPKGD